MVDNGIIMSENLPAGWALTTIDKIVIYRKGKKPSQIYTEKVAESLLYIDIKAFEKGIENQWAFLDNTVTRVDLDDILLVWDGARAGLVGTGIKGIAGSTILVLSPILVNSKYLFYFLQSIYNHVNKNTRGTGIPHVDPNYLWSINFPLAPLEEQRRIVDEIERQFSQLDTWLDIMHKLRDELPRLRASILKAAVEGRLVPQDPDDEPSDILLQHILDERRRKWEENYLAELEAKGKSAPKDDKWKEKYKEPKLPNLDGLPELPSGWIWTNISPFLSMARKGIQTGPFGTLLKKTHHRQYGIPLLGIENIGSMKFLPKNRIFIDAEKAEELLIYDAQANDILVSRSGTVGEVCVVPFNLGDARISTNLIRISLHDQGILPQFLVLLFSGSPILLEQIHDISKGTTRAFLNQEILKKLIFPLPPMNEQMNIINDIYSRLSVIDSLESLIIYNIKRAEKMRHSILKQAFEGRLVEQDTNDEPASILLERIRAERERRAEEQKKKPKQKGKAKVTTKTERKPLYDTLKAAGRALHPNELFDLSGFNPASSDDIDYFYEDLTREIQDKKRILEEKSSDNFDVFLKVVSDAN